jgi:HJR/Mrr/RecB family endonuclease
VTFGDQEAVDDLASLHHKEFEELIAELFRAKGFDAERIGGLNDHGADVIATRGRRKVAIQVKHRTNGRWIGETAVRDVHAARDFYGCGAAMVVTNSSFAPGTFDFADRLGVELWDGERLEEELLSFCVLCGTHVSESVREWCLDRPDEFRGRVYCFKHQRSARGVLRVKRA